MRGKRNLYIIVILCFITLVGVTIAYLQSTAVLENIFNAGTYKTVTHEEFVSPTNWTPGDEIPKTITTKNEGTIPVRVRVKLEEEWTSKNGDSLELTYNNEKSAIINLDNINDWILKDGYYYYTKELAPGEITSSLIKSVTFNPNVDGDVNCVTESGTVTCESSGDGYDGGIYKLNITTETVQAKNYEEIWENVPIMYDYVGDNPCTFEGELVPGAKYVNGQYTYRYRQSVNRLVSLKWEDITDDGWGVTLTDSDSVDPVTTTICSSINNKPITSMRFMFARSQATSIDLSNFDTSNVTNMESMFWNSQATTLDLNNFDTSKVVNMSGMFQHVNVTILDLSSFDTSNVTNMSWMFFGSQSTSIDLSSFDTSNVNNMESMFWNSQATSIDVSSFDTSNVTNMNWMFCGSKATSLNLSSFDTSNVTSMSNMFDSSHATTLDLSSFDTSNVTDMSYMFENSQTTTLDLSNFDTSNVIDTNFMFSNSQATTGYARTQVDADKFNNSIGKPSGLTFVVKGG